MTVLSKTDLTEYARQCTLQRRRYEECIQAAQRSGMKQATAASACSLTQMNVEALTHTSAVHEGSAQATQSCLADLLDISIEPCTWDDQQATSYDTNSGVTEARQWYSNRSQSTYQHIASSTRSNVNPVSYGAP